MKPRHLLYCIDLLRGLSYKQIAAKYGVAYETVRRQMRVARVKWHCESTEQLIGLMLVFRLITLKDVYE